MNSLKFVICFHFQVIPLQSINFDDYITLHNYLKYATYIHSDPLPHTMKLLGDVVIINNMYT